MGWLNLRAFDDELHDALRVAAAKRKTSIKALVEVATREWLERHGELEKKPTKKAKGRPVLPGQPL